MVIWKFLFPFFFRNSKETTTIKPPKPSIIMTAFLRCIFFTLANFSTTNLWVHKPFCAMSSPNSSSHYQLRSGLLFLIMYGSGQTPLSSQYVAVRVQTPLQRDKKVSWCMSSYDILSIRICWFNITLNTSPLVTAKPCLLWNNILMSN